MIWKKQVITLTAIIISIILSGCWNYREVNEMAIVAGVAIDKGENENYMVTAEILDIRGGKDARTSPELLTMEGKTLFDAVRNFISIAGKKAYWGHIQVAIVSDEIAREGITNVLNFFREDAETRGDVYLVICREGKAKDVFDWDSALTDLVSFTMLNSLQSGKNVSTFPRTQIGHFSGQVNLRGVCPTAPVVSVKRSGDRILPSLEGAAIFKTERLCRYFDGDDTRNMLFVQNEVKGGVLVVEGDNYRMALEILNSRTRVKPKLIDGMVKMGVRVETTLAIDETQGVLNFDDPVKMEEIKKEVESNLKNRLAGIIEKAQSDPPVDVFGFGDRIHENYPKEWEKLSQQWDSEFQNLQVDIEVEVNIVNTAIISKPLKKVF